jgi:hypothetical protein
MTGKELLQKLQELSEEDLNKEIILVASSSSSGKTIVRVLRTVAQTDIMMVNKEKQYAEKVNVIKFS